MKKVISCLHLLPLAILGIGQKSCTTEHPGDFDESRFISSCTETLSTPAPSLPASDQFFPC